MSNSELRAKLAKKIREEAQKAEQRFQEQRESIGSVLEHKKVNAQTSKPVVDSPSVNNQQSANHEQDEQDDSVTMIGRLSLIEEGFAQTTMPTPKVIPITHKKMSEDTSSTLLKQVLKNSKKSKEIIRQAWFYSANVSSETLVSQEKVRQVGLIYAGYRIMVAVFLVFASFSLDKTLASAFASTPILPTNIAKGVAGLYLFGALGLFALLYIYQERIRRQLVVGFAVDMLMLTLVLYSGVASDLQVVLLYMVVVAASFMLLRLPQAVVVTAVAVLSLTFQQVYYLVYRQVGFLTFGDAMMLSVSLVAVGFLSWSISQRLANAEQNAHRQAREIMRLNAINKEVINNMESGIIVVSSSGRVLIINRTAQELLNLDLGKASGLERVMEAERILVRQYPELDKWYRYQNDEQSLIVTPKTQTNSLTNRLRVSKKHLPEFGKLLIVEDLSLEQHLAQQLKLASLGQLSASIAHEIRNPLSVISQASEMLMAINQASDDNDMNELCEMIFLHTKRINRIIEDVMRLSRQEPPRQEVLTLQSWLPAFLQQYYEGENIAFENQGQTQIRFDPSQLEQIFINLVNNALRHTKKIKGKPDVEIFVHRTGQELLIDVLDNGEGVSAQGLQNLFNPFYTTSKGGTGLGLYLSQAFSEANNARLVYVPNSERTCFRLITAMVV